MKKSMIALAISVMFMCICSGCGKDAPPQGDWGAVPPNITNDLAKKSVGQFSTQDLYGYKVTEKVFSQNELTLVNVWVTWSDTCVQGLPALGELAKQYEGDSIAVVGILSNAVDIQTNEPQEEIINTGKEIMQKAEASYAVWIPDTGLRQGLLQDVTGMPTTFLVNREGKIVRKVFGTRSMEDWSVVVEENRGDKDTEKEKN